MDLTPGTGVVSVDVGTSLIRSDIDKYPGEGNAVVESRDVTKDLNGRSVRQYVVVYAVGNRRDCLMVWTERDGLYASVGVTERTAAGDQGVTCGAGERIVRELSTEPTVVPRLVTPGLVPRGFRLVATGSEWETWCPDHLSQADDQQCLMVTRVQRTDVGQLARQGDGGCARARCLDRDGGDAGPGLCARVPAVHAAALHESGRRRPDPPHGGDGAGRRLVIELHALASGGYPLFRAPWGTNVIAMVLDDDTDWDEVGEFLTDSYCEQAPKKLAARVCL